MKNLWKTVLPLALGAALAIPACWAQPKPKSQKEIEALQAVQAAKTPDEQIKAIDNVLENFADTEYKLMLLQLGMQAAQQKGDFALTVTYADRILEADPKNIFALSTLASQTVGHTREFDLDKDEKLAKVDKYANAVIADAKDAPKPRPDIPDEQWNNAKKDFTADAHSALGQAAMLRKKFDVAVNEFKTAQDTAAGPSAVITAHLGDAYLGAGKYDDAIATFDKASSMPDASPQVKSFIAAKKAAAVKAKGGAAPVPPAPGNPPPGQVEIKK